MPFFDFSHDELKKYLPARDEPADFDSFWQDTLAETRQHPLDARFEPLDCGLRTLTRRLDLIRRTWLGEVEV